MRTGVILAGGRSRRFGETDKALAPVGGTPMIRRVADRLEPILEQIVCNCRRDQRAALERALEGAPLEIEYAIDPEPDLGPVAGVRAGLDAVEEEYAAVVACDMPLVDPDALAFLADRARGQDGALARLEDGWLQPTQAVYRADVLAAACADALERGDRRLRDVVDALDCAVVAEREVAARASADTFENVNTPAELDRVAEKR